jgi:NAD(P)-dependent dehydrogenase (short-subunit alcohol dehydrogenase family)
MIIKSTPIPDMKSAYDVAGKNVIVTGGNRGIGRGITQAFAESGANIAIFCRNLESGQKAVAELEKFGGKYTAIKCDTSDYEDVKAAAAEVFKFFDSVDVLVNNAGVATTFPFLSEKGLSEWHRIINTNLHGPANVVYEVAPKMIEAGKGGVIINITSVGGQRVSGSKDHHNAPYNSSKAGLDIFSRYLAVVLGDYGIRVNSIAPGPIHSDLDKDLPPSFIAAIENDLPSHRFGEPIEIGALCVYMASPAAGMVTGVNWALDGGLLCIH